MTEWRLQAYRRWLTMEEPDWQKVQYPGIDYQSISYYSAPKQKEQLSSLDEVDPEIRKTYDKLGIPIREQEILAGVAVDYVFDSVSVATTFKKKLNELGIIFCSMSEAVHDHPELVRRYLGSVVPQGDNFFARSTRPCSPTAASSTCPRACAARWSSRPTSASTRPARASSSAP
jgi:Fe-S cluster assembly protein SufB